MVVVVVPLLFLGLGLLLCVWFGAEPWCVPHRLVVEVLPRLAVVAVEAVAGARTGGVVGGDRVAVGGGAVAVVFGTLVSGRVRRLATIKQFYGITTIKLTK